VTNPNYKNKKLGASLYATHVTEQYFLQLQIPIVYTLLNSWHGNDVMFMIFIIFFAMLLQHGFYSVIN
jgi:hypothetical protein